MPTPEFSIAELDAQHCEALPTRRLMTYIKIINVGNNITVSGSQNAAATVSGIGNTAWASNNMDIGNIKVIV